MRRLFRNKKAVSPVVATLLLVALTVSAAAIVYFVVIPMLKNDNKIEFGITSVSDFKDYDHDGKIDALKVNIVVVTTYGTGAANMSKFDYVILSETETYQWVYTRAGASLIGENSDGDVVISAWSSSGELVEGQSYTIKVTYGSKSETKSFVAGEAIPGPAVTVHVIDQDSNPVAGAAVDYYYANDAFVGKPTQTTPSSGQVLAYLKIGEYKVKVSYQGFTYWSETFFHPQISTVTVRVGGGGPMMTVHVIGSSGGLEGLTVYGFDPFGRYIGEHAQTNANGDAFLTINPGTYVFKVFYLGLNYSSPLVDYPTVNETTINIGGGTVYARVIDSDNVGQFNFRVYLFSSTGSYLGISRRTNQTGYAAFTLSEGAYRFRVDYGGARSWSEIFGAADGAVINIYIGGKVYAHVVYGAAETPLANVRVYLFTAAGSYTGLSARTNATGYALFNPVARNTYFKFRVDYAGSRIWSNEFTGENATTIVTINIGGQVFAHVVYGSDNNPIANVRVYLYTSWGSYTGLSARTNQTGYARFNGVLRNTDYKFRVDYAGGQFWSTLFNGSVDGLVVDINIGGTVYAYVVYGPENETLANVRVYLFTSWSSYTGLSARTNATGYARFNGVLSNTNYRFRVDYAGSQYWSTLFNGSVDGLVVEINIGGIVYGHVVYGPDDSPLANVRVYLFTSWGSYTGLSARTNASGYARFNGVLSTTNYKFRVDYAGGQYWSSTFNGSLPVYVHEMNIGGIVYCQVVYGTENNPLNNVRVYLYTSWGSYTGLSARTNATGHARFNGVLRNTNYKFRIDYAGGQFWSTTFNGSLPVYTHVVNIGGTVFCYANDAGTPLVNYRIYLFTEGGAYAGLSALTNASGYAQFNGVLSNTNYRFRVTYDSSYHWSDVFDGSVDKRVVNLDVSIMLALDANPAMDQMITTTTEPQKIKITS